MPKLSTIFLHRLAAPCIQITVLVNRSIVILSSIDLNRLEASQTWNQLHFFSRGAHLDHSLVLKQAQCRVVVACDHAHTMHAQRLLDLELEMLLLSM